MDLDRQYGPWSGRVWGLIANFVGNAVALYGFAGYLRDGSHLAALVIGVVLSVACILWLSKPSR